MEDLLGKKLVIKATEIKVGDFLQGNVGTGEVVGIQTQPDRVLVNLAVIGVVQLDPTWDVAVFRNQDETTSWRKLYDERVRQAANDGSGCGQCIRGWVQFSQEYSDRIPCGFCDRA